jgi:hypothetical protein
VDGSVGQSAYSYRIDAQDRIRRVSEPWQSFAEENQGSPEVCRPEAVLGRPLWEFIEGIETRHLYQHLVKKAREGIRLCSIPFRCDSPEERRFLHLDIHPLDDGALEFHSTLVRSERRASLRLLDRRVPRSLQVVRLCSMCKCIAAPKERWLELEEGLQELRIFEEERMPQLTHGLCPVCFQRAMAVLPGYRPSRDLVRALSNGNQDSRPSV